MSNKPRWDYLLIIKSGEHQYDIDDSTSGNPSVFIDEDDLAGLFSQDSLEHVYNNYGPCVAIWRHSFYEPDPPEGTLSSINFIAQ